jgi:signal transduction histidine kinase
MKYKYVLMLISILALVFSIPSKLEAQPPYSLDYNWQKLAQSYKSSQIKPTQYLALVDSMAIVNVDNPRLKEYLQTYKNLVWKYDSSRRKKYYYYLICNAKVNGQSGKVLYYVEKYAKEPGTINANHLLDVEKMQLFITSGDFFRATAIFDHDSSYQNDIPIKIAHGGYQGHPMSDLFLFYQITSAFFELKDSVRLFHVLDLAAKTYANTIKTKAITPWEKQMCYSFLQASKCYGYQFQLKIDSTEMVLKEIAKIAAFPDKLNQTNQIILQQQLLQNVIRQLLDFYIATGNVDSAKQYQRMAEGLAGINFMENDIWLLKSRSLIQALSGDYKAAFKTMERIFQKTDTLLKRKTVEISENMYAQALAEDKKEEAEILSAEKGKLIIGGVIGLILFLSVISFFYGYAKMKEKRMKFSIDLLNQTTALQIAELEEKGRFLQQVEKEKLGMELHDGLSNQLAYIKILTELAVSDVDSPTAKAKLVKINELISDAYSYTRNKSHEWYNLSHIQQEKPFSEKILRVIENALPSQLLKKELLIDEHHLNILPLASKIELMYIIQESLTNILKHTKSGKIVLLIYEEFETLIYRVKDNGKGFDVNAKKGLGIQGIRNRSFRIGGKSEIISDKNGSELIVTIPLTIQL